MSRRQQRARQVRRKQANAKMRALGVAGGVAVASLGVAVPAQAAFDHVYTVTNTTDSATAGSGSLRDAITQANASPGDDEIVFASSVSGSIALTSDLPKLTTELTIQGPGARQLAIDAAGIAAPVHPTLEDSRYASNGGVGSLSISGLTLEHGATGSVYNYGEALTLDDVTVTGDGTPPSAHASVDAVEGGGSAVTTVEHSTITGTFGNTGDALYSYAGTLVVSDSTITGNTQGGNGGIDAYEGTTTVDDSTITNNAGSAHAGGINLLGGAILILRDSVVSGNTTTGSTGYPDINVGAGSTATVDFSLLGQNPSTPETGLTLDSQSTALAGQNPKLGPLQNNGGPTDTEQPLAGSPLLDAGQAFGLTSDQRGATRPVRVAGTTVPTGGDGSDIGAVEAQPPVLTGVSPATGAAGSTATITGSGFTGATGVSFGLTPASSFTVTDDGHISAVVPAGSGTLDVRVTTPYGQTPVAAADHFTYPAIIVLPPPPARPVVSGLSAHSGSSGESVKILGSHLAGASTVHFGSVKATFHVQSDGVVVATVPKGKGRADVTVTGPGGTSAAGAGDRFSYLVATVGHKGSSARWKGSSVVVDTGLSASCPKGGDRCSVSVKATSTVPASLAKVRKTKTKSLTLGSASFHVSAGKRGGVTFTLTRKGLKALEKLGKLKITVVVTVVDGSVTTKQSRTITIHLPKKPKPKKR